MYNIIAKISLIKLNNNDFRMVRIVIYIDTVT